MLLNPGNRWSELFDSSVAVVAPAWDSFITFTCPFVPVVEVLCVADVGSKTVDSKMEEVFECVL